MKTKLIGLAILLVVIIGAVLYVVLSDEKEMTEINGFVGGEKIGMLEDEEIQEILRDDYGLVIDYAKAGSIDMISADSTGKDFLFPSNQTALELYEQQYGEPVRSEIILNTPIVLYTRSAVAQALLDEGIVSEQDGVYYADMALLTECIETGRAWADIGLPQLYGNVAVSTTDPTKSNSGNMFAALLAKVQGNPTLAPAEEVFRWATLNGAEAFGIDAGKIEKGRLADAVLLDLSSPRMNPCHSLVSNVVYSADSSCIRAVLCGGRIVFDRDRKCPALPLS